MFPELSSGIVIAGFGENQHFPGLITYTISGISMNKLKYSEETQLSHHIGPRGNAVIIPFAESEMVHTFMQGVGPNYSRIFELWLRAIFDKYIDTIADIFRIKDVKQKKVLKGRTFDLLEEFLDKMKTYRRDEHVQPVVEVVASLPKNELADMAENLVSLTSFKLRVSPGLESVAGPIDVAVISKGDGFVWIKRKHYFKREFNERFISNYFSEE